MQRGVAPWQGFANPYVRCDQAGAMSIGLPCWAQIDALSRDGRVRAWRFARRILVPWTGGKRFALCKARSAIAFTTCQVAGGCLFGFRAARRPGRFRVVGMCEFRRLARRPKTHLD